MFDRAEGWIVAATVATAIFTGGGLVISCIIYWHSRVDTARSNPIEVRKAKRAALFDVSSSWHVGGGHPDLAYRLFDVHIYNRSSVPQGVTLIELEVKDEPRWVTPDREMSFGVPAYSGGNVVLRAFNTDCLRMSEEEFNQTFNPKERTAFKIVLTLATVSGHEAKYIGWTTFRRV